MTRVWDGCVCGANAKSSNVSYFTRKSTDSFFFFAGCK